jgi:heat shock protein HtpX
MEKCPYITRDFKSASKSNQENPNMGNQLRTTLLLAAMTALILWIGQMFGGRQGMLIALFIAAAMNFFSYWYSDKLVLRMYRAQPISSQQAPELFDTLTELTRRAGLPMPTVYLIPNDTPNAFATGRDPQHAVVAVTRGLIQLMTPKEIEGVLAHELSHVKNRDILIGSIAATLAGAIMVMANFARWTAIFGGGRRDDNEGGMGAIGLIAMSILAPLAAMLIQMAVSRSREYQADASAAGLIGSGEGLASALSKLEGYAKRRPMQAHPSTSHMFIVNPLKSGGVMNLFSTHPPIDQRIARLRGRSSTTHNNNQMPPPPSKDDPLSSGRAFWDNLK